MASVLFIQKTTRMDYKMTTETKMMLLLCSKCSEIFSIPSRRGRPPKFCAQCSNGVEPPVVVAKSPQVITQREDQFTGSLADPTGKTFSYLNGIKMMSHFCLACKEVFAIPARRGRPPNYCSECISSGRAQSYEEQRMESLTEKARVRVDNLEMMLKSRGTHIRQQKDRW